jgi:hypothetical protein
MQDAGTHTISHVRKMYQHFTFKGPPKFMYPNLNFWYANMHIPKPSGNSDVGSQSIKYTKAVYGTCFARTAVLLKDLSFMEMYSMAGSQNIRFFSF